MNDFTWGGAWSLGWRFVARGAILHFLILTLVGIAAPLALQYVLVGGPIGSTSSPMTSGPMMMQAMGAPIVLLALALAHMLQSGSFFASLRFGYTGAREPVGPTGFGLAAGVVATLVVAFGYLVAVYGAQAIAAPGTLEIALLVLTLPLIIVYSLFFISQAIMGAAAIVSTLLLAFLIGAIQGYPEAAARVFGGGLMTVIMLLLSGLLFWLAARFSCVTALMAQRGTLNVFWAIGESWRMTSDDQFSIMRYLALVGFAIALVVIGTLFAIGASTSGLDSRGFGFDTTTDLVLRFVFGVPMAFLSVMLPAGIHQQLVGEDTPTEIFE